MSITPPSGLFINCYLNVYPAGVAGSDEEGYKFNIHTVKKQCLKSHAQYVSARRPRHGRRTLDGKRSYFGVEVVE